MSRTISRSVGRGGVNQSADVKTVQELLNDNIDKIKPLSALVPDGRIGPMTQGAIDQFQKVVVRMALPDGRVDPGGRTLTLLNQGSKPSIVAPIVATTFRVTFQHFSKTPEPKSSTKGTDAMYESTVTVSGGKTGTFRGSIYPDDMSVKGRIKDGTYDIYIGFHKREGHTPKAGDLVARSQGFRAALIVNGDNSVPVESNNPSKTTSALIHVHNGFNSQRFSDGCPTIHPSDWNKFIQLFLDTYSNLSDWTETSTYIGKKIGTLEVKA